MMFDNGEKKKPLREEWLRIEKNPKERRRLWEVEQEGFEGKSKVLGLIQSRANLREEERAILSMNPEDEKTLDKYENYLVRKRRLQEAEDMLLGKSGGSPSVSDDIKERITFDPLQKAQQIFADYFKAGEYRREVERRLVEDLSPYVTERSFERRDYPADAPLLRHPYDRRSR